MTIEESAQKIQGMLQTKKFTVLGEFELSPNGQLSLEIKVQGAKLSTRDVLASIAHMGQVMRRKMFEEAKAEADRIVVANEVPK